MYDPLMSMGVRRCRGRLLLPDIARPVLAQVWHAEAAWMAISCQRAGTCCRTVARRRLVTLAHRVRASEPYRTDCHRVRLVRQPHHPGALWWLMAAVAVVALWALGEMLRWRIKYRRLLIAQQASSSEPPPQPIGKLLTDGKELQANIGNHMSWWGADRLLPNGAPGRIVRWEGNVSEALINQPEIRALFQNAPDLDVNRPISGQAYGRLEYELKVLESAVNDGTGDFNSNSDQSAIARVESGLAAYYAERVKSLQEVHEDGCMLRTTIVAANDRDAETDSTLMSLIGKWDKKVRNVLMYWPDLNTFGWVSSTGLSSRPNIEEVYEGVGQRLEVLQTAIKRLPR